jgi:methionyl-tRNA formyltransferase
MLDRVALAAFYTPGIRAIEHLLALGYTPEQIRLLTHEHERNGALIEFARTVGIEYRTESVRSDDVYRWLARFQPDVLFSLYYQTLIPVRVLSIPHVGAVNLHPALLPQYRGCWSGAWAIINGEKMTGFTYHFMDATFDTGNVLFQTLHEVKPDDTAFSLYHRLIDAGMKVFPHVLWLLEHNATGVKQIGPSQYYSRAVPFGGVIDPRWDDAQVERFIRAMYFPPFPPAMVISREGQQYAIRSMDDYRQIQYAAV